ncbi:major facilitator superfamily domain-containing protein [Limtongia smithiae]|uniref:major facilitator superfamily domain-containing protein n=1 Tax=Limtongia smithiae TaxID=1125753 RepID=UPI0034CF6EE3
MGLGVLQDHKLAHVPGTSLLDDEFFGSEGAPALKHFAGADGHIVLVPQPSDDPNDPLNWKLRHRDLLLLVHTFGYVMCSAVPGPLLAAATSDMATALNVTVTDIALLTGYQLLVAGLLGPFVSALSRKYGKRPQFVGASFACLIGTIICACSDNYSGILAGRIIQGVGSCAYESMVVSLIGDMYFLHERGLRMALFNFYFGAVNLSTSIIAGPIATHLGWKYLFYIYIPFMAIQCLLMVFCATETMFIRDAVFEIDVNGEDTFVTDAEKAPEPEHLEKQESVNASTPARSVPEKRNYWRTIALCHGTYSSESLIVLFLRPIAIILNPAICWIVLAMAIPLAWIVCINYSISQLYSVEPYNLSAQALGFLSIGPLIAGIIVSVFFYFISDPMAVWVSRKNNGVFEPEFRLPICVMLGSFGVAFGCFGFGNFYEQGRGAIVSSAMIGMLCGGMTAVTIGASNYTVDAYRELSIEIVILVMSFKNILFYGFSYFFNNWVTRKGPAQVFDVLGAISLVVCFGLSIPLYIFGKRVRSWWSRAQLLRKLKLGS